MRRRIAILAVACTAMLAAPAGIAGASAATPQSNRTVLCLGNSSLLGKSICIPMVQL